MKQILKKRFHLLTTFALVLYAMPLLAADCYLNLQFTESSDGEFTEITYSTIYNELYNQAIVNELNSPDAPRQIQFIGSNAAGEDVVLARFGTGMLLQGIGEGFTGGNPSESIEIVDFETAQKRLFLPLSEGLEEIRFITDGEVAASVQPTAADLNCVESCSKSGEEATVDQPCCIGLSLIASDEGGFVCSDTGDGVCESWEDEKSAPNDCAPEVELNTCLDGFQTPLNCSQLVASYKFLGNGANLVRSNYPLEPNDSVTFSDEGGAIFSGPRGALSGGAFDSLPLGTVFVKFTTGRNLGTIGLVSFANSKESITVGLMRGRPTIQFAARTRGLEVNGVELSRIAPVRGPRSGATFFRGRTGLVIGRQAISQDENAIAITRAPIPEETNMFVYTLYLNGTEVISARTNFEMNFEDLSPRFFLGRDQLGRVAGDNSIIGEISEVRVFTRVASEIELEQLFAQ